MVWRGKRKCGKVLRGFRDLRIRRPPGRSAYPGAVPDATLTDLMESTVLYRPVGQREHELIEASGFRRFPPRLPGHPFFYPVTNETYATEIARDWNTKDEQSAFVGYVLRFRVQSEFLTRYPVRIVGAAIHQEY